jgi:mono/diheme cytochrome c family protein
MQEDMGRLIALLTVLALALAACSDGTSTEPPTSAASDLPSGETATTSAVPDLPGKELATRGRCFGCHTTLGAKATGPTFLGLSGSQRPLESGETVIADDAYLEQSIVDPGSQIVEGFANVMPGDYGDTFSEQEINDLIDYIKSLD